MSPGDNPPVDWFEVLGSNAEHTQSFYREVFGWTFDHASEGYRLVQHEHDAEGRDLQIGGGLGAGEGDRWATVYARVPVVEAALTKAESLGGKRVYGPDEVSPDLTSGAFRDPAGNVFGVYQTK